MDIGLKSSVLERSGECLFHFTISISHHGRKSCSSAIFLISGHNLGNENEFFMPGSLGMM